MSSCMIDETCGFEAIEKARTEFTGMNAELAEANERAEGACPVCGSTNVVSLLRTFSSGAHMAGCFACKALWEALPHGEPYRRDGELMPWSEPCDNCAFRAGSPESKDREKWRALLDKLKAGGQFFCHKGVPIKMDELQREHVIEFDYPVTAAGEPDRERLRTCRGYLNAWMRWMSFPTQPPTGDSDR